MAQFFSDVRFSFFVRAVPTLVLYNGFEEVPLFYCYL